MKLPLATATGLFSAAAIIACATSGGGSSGNGSTTKSRYVMRVDRTYDRSTAPQPTQPNADLPADSYKAAPATDRWEVTIEGQTVILTAIGGGPSASAGASRLEGKEISPSPPSAAPNGERRFDIDKGAFAGGRFVVRGEEAELTVFGSGVPVVSSERGKLAPIKAP